MVRDFCSCDGPRFVLTITATDPVTGERESGPTVRCCLKHVLAAKVIANDLQDRDPALAIDFDVTRVDDATAAVN